MRKIEDFINQLDTSGIGNDATKFSDMLKRLADSEITLHIDLAYRPPAEQPPADVLARVREENKMRRHLVTIKPEVYGIGGGAFIGNFNGDQVYGVFLEEYRAKYGDQWVNDAIDVARRSGVSIHDSIVAKANAEALAAAINSIGVSFADIAKAFNTLTNGVLDGIARGVTQANEALHGSTPNNRHERRAAKHDKRIKEGDQVWQRRTRRKYRR